MEIRPLPSPCVWTPTSFKMLICCETWAESYFCERAGRVWTLKLSLQNSQWLADPHLGWGEPLPTTCMHQYLVSLQHPESKGAIAVSPAGAAIWITGTRWPLFALCTEDIEARSGPWVRKSTKVDQKWDSNKGLLRLCTQDTGLRAKGSEQN